MHNPADQLTELIRLQSEAAVQMRSYMPVFFGLAGLHANLAIVKNPSLLLLSLGFIVIASVGKFSGAFLGGAFGSLCGAAAAAWSWTGVALAGASFAALALAAHVLTSRSHEAT